jgi:exopolyphosphatase/guanosine-5'-triphosphate,3'-diphosphate pyrophosphatase
MTRYAAIDVGTNTVRVLIADGSATGIKPVARAVQITRLGESVDANREMRPEAIDRTAETVARFAAQARDAGAGVVRIAGTSALRDAYNRADFQHAVESRTGLDLEILAGEDEGRLSFLGATSWLSGGGPFLVCDIGGGSTEFVRGDEAVEAVWSADVGSVRLRERYLTSDPPTAGEIEGARSLLAAELLQVERDVALVGDEALIGIAGTVTSLAALALGLTTYDTRKVHGARLRRDQVDAWAERLLNATVDEVRALPTMQPGRADIIGAGALILRDVMRRWSFDEVLVSERDILDGLVLELILGPGAGLPAVKHDPVQQVS